MKKFFESENTGFGLLASANIALAGFEKFFQSLEPILHILLTGGQIGVACFTMYYVFRKARAVKVPEDKPKRKRNAKR